LVQSVLYFPQVRDFLQPAQASFQAEQQAYQKTMAQAESQGLPAYRELMVQPVSQAQTANHSTAPLPALARL